MENNVEIRAIDIADFLGLALYGDDIKIRSVSSLASIKQNSLVFVKKIQNPEIQGLIDRTDVFAILPIDFGAQHLKCSRVFSKKPRLSFALAVEKFFSEKRDPEISTLAIISDKSSIGNNVSIGPYSIVEEGVIIGDNTEIRNNVLVKRGSKIGKCCIVRSYSVIGEEGFGLEPDEEGRYIRIPHIGGVMIGDNVEVGNFCSICKGTIDDTIVEDGVKIDDHCHIAHNVTVGINTIITAGVVLAGSASLGNFVWIGPNATILNGLSVLDNATVGIGSVVIRTVPEESHVLGNPATRSK